MIDNPQPILKQQKSEITTNPLILGDIQMDIQMDNGNQEEREQNIINIKRKPFLLDTNIEFTQTIDEICYELYETKKIRMTRKKIKWIGIILISILIVYWMYVASNELKFSI